MIEAISVPTQVFHAFQVLRVTSARTGTSPGDFREVSGGNALAYCI